MKVLVFLEHHDDTLGGSSLGVLTAARALGADEVAALLVGGADVAGLADHAGRAGASTVYVAAAPELAPPLAQPRIDVLEHVVRDGGFDTVLFSNSVLAADVAAGLAARLEAGLNWDLVDLAMRDGDLVGTRPALQDSVLVEVGWRTPVRLALFRAGTFEAGTAGDAPRVETVTAPLADHSGLATLVRREVTASEGPSIEDADVIVAGGLGLGSAEHFTLAETLADLLGGAVAATRAVVYKGWYPHAAQVGQTGKTVTPKLYLALGISGAVQHKVGMQNSKVIVAINKDPNAPIFEFSDLAVVGDVHTIVPELIELLRARAGAS